jgi:predicted nucleotidyltransferase
MTRNEVLDILRDYKGQFADRYGITALGIFGSVARGQNRENSDVDVCIRTKTPDPFVLVHIKEDIERRLNQPVDIVRVRDRMNPFLKQRIETEGIYV